MSRNTIRKYAELRPDELDSIVKDKPVAFWPLGLLEYHSWHLPIGFDGLKAEKICERICIKTGGVILPTLWSGGLGGHGIFPWSIYQKPDIGKEIVINTVCRLAESGFRIIVLFMGHYPWEEIITSDNIEELEKKFPNLSIIAGTEMTIGGSDLSLPGDHAAKEETSLGLSLFPELIKMENLKSYTYREIIPEQKMTDLKEKYPELNIDSESPQFAQLGTDAREASAERGELHINKLVENVEGRVNRLLKKIK